MEEIGAGDADWMLLKKGTPLPWKEDEARRSKEERLLNEYIEESNKEEEKEVVVTPRPKRGRPPKAKETPPSTGRKGRPNQSVRIETLEADFNVLKGMLKEVLDKLQT